MLSTKTHLAEGGQVKYNTARIEIQVPFSEDGYVFDIGSLLTVS